MKKSIRKYVIGTLETVLLLALVLFTSCEEDYNPQIDSLLNTALDSLISEGEPGDLVVIDGSELGDLESITFKGVDTEDEVPVVYNPAYNSDISIFFNVPWDEEAGSQFGANTITLTNTQGDQYTSEFTILQPAPAITAFTPSPVKPGQALEITGNWFYGLDSLILGDLNLEWDSYSATSINFRVPEMEQGQYMVRVVTESGAAEKLLEVVLGKITLVSDFDGNGTHPITGSNGSFDWAYWWMWGDMNGSVSLQSTDGYSGKYMQWDWDGTTTEGYMGGSNSTEADTAFNLEETDPERILCEQHLQAPIGTVVHIILQDNESVHWGYIYTFERDDWHLVSIPMSEFGYDKDPEVQTPDPDPQKIHRVGYEFEQELNSAPLRMKSDNVRFVELFPE